MGKWRPGEYTLIFTPIYENTKIPLTKGIHVFIRSQGESRSLAFAQGHWAFEIITCTSLKPLVWHL